VVVSVSGKTFDEHLMPGVVFCQTEAWLTVDSRAMRLLSARLGADWARGAGRDRSAAVARSMERLGALIEEKLGEITGG
jgi:hypothetical protein